MPKLSNICFNLTFVLSRKLLRAVAANAAPFLCNFCANFALCYTLQAKTQMQVKRMLDGLPSGQLLWRKEWHLISRKNTGNFIFPKINQKL